MTKTHSITDPVLRSFRKKFVIITMSFVAALLVGMLAIASYMSFIQRVDDIKYALDERSDHIHRMPVELLLDGRQIFNRHWTDPITELYEEGVSEFTRDMGERRDAGTAPLVVTSAYLLDEDADIQLTISNSLDLDEATIEEALDDIRKQLDLGEGQTEFGKMNKLNLYYQLRDYSNGYSVALASGNYIDRSMHTLVSTLGLIELLVFLLLLLLSVFLSYWVVAPIERAWQQQNQFIADASHELKTPLSVIRANDSLLMSNPSASVASQMQWIESTETEAMLMQDLVNDMLFLAQSENTDSEVIHTTVDFSNVVEGVELQFESVAFERNITIESSIAPGVKVLGEEKSLNRLVGTLIDNACKYAQGGGKVVVKLIRMGSQCALNVNNTGDSIPEEDLSHVFDRFYRSDKARTREQGGFGLGLAIAKSIVDEHKGSIDVNSSPAEGTTFTVVLPLA